MGGVEEQAVLSELVDAGMAARGYPGKTSTLRIGETMFCRYRSVDDSYDCPLGGGGRVSATMSMQALADSTVDYMASAYDRQQERK